MYDNLTLLKDIVENTPLPIGVYVGEELKIELANPAMIQILGKGSQVIGKTFKELLPELEARQIFDQVTGVFRTGIAFHAKDKKVELVIDGIAKTRYFNYSFVPLTDAEGRIYGVMNTGVDVTDLYLARLQVQSAEEKLRIAIDASGMGTYEIDLKTQQITTCGNFNAIWSAGQNITNKELIAKLHPEVLGVREKAHKEAQKTGIISYEARIIKEDQSIRWAKINGKIIKDLDGRAVTIIGIIQDISGQRQFEQELKKQVTEHTRELRRSNDDLLHFASVVSHDLKEPVRKIMIFNAFLRSDLESGSLQSAERYLGKIDHSALRMHAVIEGILDYSTIDKTAQPVQKIGLNEIMEHIKTDLELVIKEKNAILIVSELAEIEGAPILIQQLFYNIVHNALKFSKSDQPPRVIISSALVEIKGSDFVRISIKDNGIGLDSSHFQSIFKAFERLHSKDEYEGNGLGLALCRKIAKRHNGTIEAFGDKNNGAEFIVTLPLKQFKTAI
ncbi:ATP-binding protein [Flavobacterium sp. UBA7680]|uniref:ATP-binding protein n=1 Tax=Flavobacterium sp. UBA7680 TaxID=1946559 RepID=UPI0025BE2897|nr:ATP-binding protein [Flavobacterium sp. UBA7680]